MTDRICEFIVAAIIFGAPVWGSWLWYWLTGTYLYF